jgi:hypothetical protein
MSKDSSPECIEYVKNKSGKSQKSNPEDKRFGVSLALWFGQSLGKFIF